MIKRILITGAGGFIGRALTASLADRGFHIVAADNNCRGSLNTIEERGCIEKHLCDVLDANRVMTICEGVDAVYHLAAINGTGNFYSIPEKVLEVGIIGTHNVLQACIRNKVKHFFLASTSEVYHLPAVIPTPEEVECKVPDIFNPRFSYGGGKIASELMTVHYLRNTDTRYVILRPHNVYGPNMGTDHVIPQVTERFYKGVLKVGKSQEKLFIEIQGNGDETRSFVFISDIVRAIELCTLGNMQSGLYHIGTEDEIKIRDLVWSIGEMLGIKAEIVPTRGKEGGTSRRCPDTKKIRQLGFRPEVSLKQGLAETVAWYWNYYKCKENGVAG